MNRRPWPIIWMALLQFLTPVIYLCTAAIFYHISVGSTTNEIRALTPELRQFEIFILPIILGLLVLSTRKWAYYIVIIGSLYSIVRGVMTFFASNQTDPVFPLVFSNLICLVVVIVLLRSKNREVYFNPRLRWWETSPRYIVDLSASVTRVGAKPMKAILQNVATGGAGIETMETGFLTNEIVDLEFQYEGEAYHLKSKIVWEKSNGSGKQCLGIQWADDNRANEWSKLRRLLRGLKTKHTKTTRHIPPRLVDIKEWFAKLAG